MAKKADKDPYKAPLEIGSERALRANIRAICQRFNADPDLARLLIVNPILAFEDAGITLSEEMRAHVMQALRFPPKQRQRIAALEDQIKPALAARGLDDSLPLSGERRAELVFTSLKLQPLAKDREGKKAPRALAAERLIDYAPRHELLGLLARYERARQGALIFQRRSVYDAYKAGKKEHRWIKAVRFNV